MRSLFRIIRRYSLTAGMIICVLFVSNAAAFLFWGFQKTQVADRHNFKRSTLETVSEELVNNNGSWQLSEKGEKALKASETKWGMALDENGKAVWEWQLPKDFARSYTNRDIAKFTRWYLKDYPVMVWDTGILLLVIGLDPQIYTRFSETYLFTDFAMLPEYIKIALIVNAAVIVVLVFLLGARFYHALKPLGIGIERLSRQEPVKLREKGMTKDLAVQINHTSEILQEQKESLNRRDQARTDWISGVSHDIRTPLALILGYTDRISRSSSLNEEEKRMADAVCRQGLVIRQLISDLNLTSKLAYDAQPLKCKKTSPALLLRECAADIYNEELEKEEEPGQVDVELLIPPEAEKIEIFADKGLVKRALRNLIGNSVRHNPSGCQVQVRLFKRNNMACFFITDTGRGIPEIVVQNMENSSDKIHIMGLRLARQIARAHGGELEFVKRESGTYDVEICFPEDFEIVFQEKNNYNSI